MNNKQIPKGFRKCKVCGEYKGEVATKDLNQEGLKKETITVSCLCEGILCSKCKKNKIHRPISNSYDIKSNSVWHWPYFTGMMSCSECNKLMEENRK